MLYFPKKSYYLELNIRLYIGILVISDSYLLSSLKLSRSVFILK